MKQPFIYNAISDVRDLSESMHQVILKTSFIEILIWHFQLALDTAVIAPQSGELAFIRPLHFSVSISFIEFPFTFEPCWDILADNVIILIYAHQSISTSFAVFKHASVAISTSVLDLAPAVKPALFEMAMFEVVMLALKVATYKLLYSLHVFDVVLSRFEHVP